MKNNTTNFQKFSFGTQVRKSPYSDAALKWGAKGFSVYNHMYIPRDFGDPVKNFWNLVNDAILCDVAVERQVQISGPDAGQFVQLMSCRDLSKLAVGQCKYVILTDQDGGILNDPILLRVEENKYWFSIADSDVLFWAKGLAVNSGLDVTIEEPDVSPLQLQGPKSQEILRAAFGDEPTKLKYYWLMEVEWQGIPLIISRTGWSSELGYEIYLTDGSKGTELWDYIMEIGQPLGLHPGHTSSIRRIEAAMLSYQADMTIANNPFELGLGRLIDLESDIEFVSKAALTQIHDRGVSQLQVGLEVDGPPLIGSNDEFWPLLNNGRQVGKITSAVYSPRLEKNIALGFVETSSSVVGTKLNIQMSDDLRSAQIVPKPFFDPKKSLATKPNA